MIKYELHLCQSPAQEEALSFLNSLSLSGEVGLQLAGMEGDGGMLRWRGAGMGREGCWDGGMLGWKRRNSGMGHRDAPVPGTPGRNHVLCFVTLS